MKQKRQTGDLARSRCWPSSDGIGTNCVVVKASPAGHVSRRLSSKWATWVLVRSRDVLEIQAWSLSTPVLWTKRQTSGEN